MTRQLPHTTVVDPIAAIDSRSRRISEVQGFGTLEPVTRWVLLFVATSTLAIGVHDWLAGLR